MVDVDLEKFFDHVNHDVLMGRLAKRIADRRVLVLIRRYLEAGVLANGVVMERHEGTPQGGPLSPLLANVLLDEVDQELEKRGPRVRTLRRRLQRVRASRSGRARDAATAAALRATSATGQRVQECGRPGLEPEDPRLLVLDRPRSRGEAPGGGPGPRRDEGTCPPDHEAASGDGASRR